MMKERFKGIVKQSVKAISLKYLLSMKQKQSKMDSLEYSELKTQSYLTEHEQSSWSPVSSYFKQIYKLCLAQGVSQHSYLS